MVSRAPCNLLLIFQKFIFYKKQEEEEEEKLDFCFWLILSSLFVPAWLTKRSLSRRRHKSLHRHYRLLARKEYLWWETLSTFSFQHLKVVGRLAWRETSDSKVERTVKFQTCSDTFSTSNPRYPLLSRVKSHFRECMIFLY